MSARARLVEVVFRDQDGVYDISIGTTIAEDRTCAASIEAALATIFGLTPEQVVLTVKAVSQDEVDCVFHTKLDSDFAPSWTGISREGGHGFHGKLDSDFTRSWTVAA